MRHGRRTDFTSLNLLLEVIHGDVGPHVFVQIHHHSICTPHRITPRSVQFVTDIIHAPIDPVNQHVSDHVCELRTCIFAVGSGKPVIESFLLLGRNALLLASCALAQLLPTPVLYAGTALGAALLVPPAIIDVPAAESDVPIARTIRRNLRIWVDEGRSESFIRDELVSIYGEDIDYSPSTDGISALVWVLPIVGGVVAVAGLSIVFRGWKAEAASEASAADEALVAAARRERHDD